MTDPLYVVFGGYPAATLAAAFFKANLVAAIMILAVAPTRILVRRAFGPAAAYHLWGLPAAAGFLMFVVGIAEKHDDPAIFAFNPMIKIGRASCRERG